MYNNYNKLHIQNDTPSKYIHTKVHVMDEPIKQNSKGKQEKCLLRRKKITFYHGLAP